VPVAEAAAPCRADLAGGTLDIWPLGLLVPGAVTVNAAIRVMVRVAVSDEGPRGAVVHELEGREPRLLSADDAAGDLTAAVAFSCRPAGGLRIRVLAQAPVGSGLGGSSAYAVAVARAVLALEGRETQDAGLVAVLRDLEARILGAPTGTQDYWSALAGGVLAVHPEPGGERVERLEVDAGWLAARLTVFFTGIVHHSGRLNWRVLRRFLDGDPGTVDAMRRIAAAARDCRDAVLAKDPAATARAITAEWAARRELAPEICPPELEAILQRARRAGAAAVKACGAGGGGSLLVWHEPGKRAAVVRELDRAAPEGKVFGPGIAEAGCTVAVRP